MVSSDFEACFCTTTQLTGQAIAVVWAKILGLNDNAHLAGLVLRLSIENFYLQITDGTINHQWFNSYFAQLLELVEAFKNNAKHPALDGTV